MREQTLQRGMQDEHWATAAEVALEAGAEAMAGFRRTGTILDRFWGSRRRTAVRTMI